MNPDDNDKLWELLGKAGQPSVSPFFARNVLRAVRTEREASRTALGKLWRALHRRSWQLALASTCVAALLATMSPTMSVRHHRATPAKLNAFNPELAGNSDYEVIKHLDELKADEEGSVWLDDSANVN